MNKSDLMICVGARFDDRITGKVSGFSPNSLKIHMDIDASSFNKSQNGLAYPIWRIKHFKYDTFLIEAKKIKFKNKIVNGGNKLKMEIQKLFRL